MFGRRYSAAFIAIQPLAEYLKNEPSRTALKNNHKEGVFQIFFIFFWGGAWKTARLVYPSTQQNILLGSVYICGLHGVRGRIVV